MKRHQSRYRQRSFRPLKLYKEDIEYVVELVQGACEKVSISNDEYSFDSLNEAEDRYGKKITNLSIDTQAPTLHISLGKRMLNPVICSEENKVSTFDLSGEHLFYQVSDFLAPHQRLLGHVFRWRTWVILGVIVYVVTRALETGKSLVATRAVEGISVAWALYCFFAAYFVWRGLSSLSFESRYKHESFFQRNKDKLIILALGAALTEAVHWLISLFSKPNH